jgi:hypothetical protein
LLLNLMNDSHILFRRFLVKYFTISEICFAFESEIFHIFVCSNFNWVSLCLVFFFVNHKFLEFYELTKP